LGSIFEVLLPASEEVYLLSSRASQTGSKGKANACEMSVERFKIADAAAHHYHRL